jgi:hypothetical protein
MAKKSIALKSPYDSNGQLRAPKPMALAAPPAALVRTTLAIRPEQLKALRLAALERGCDVGELVRGIVGDWMKANQ